MAWQQGADAIEGDFHLTKDERIVCFHNKRIRTHAGETLFIANSTLSELRKIDVGGKSFKGAAIPTIAEVFATVPKGKRIYIEIKCGAEIIPALLSEVDGSGLSKEQIVVISFKQEVLQELKAKAPHYKASWLCRFKKEETGEVTPSIEKVLSTLKLIQADGLSSNTAVPHSVIETVRQHGYEWHVWTINDLEKAGQLKALGAESITTDVPGHMREHLVENLLQATP